MPIGIITDVLSVVAGGLLGSIAGKKIPESLSLQLNMILGLCSVAMGILTVSGMKNMPAVVLSIISGTLIGLLGHLGKGINKAAELMQKIMPGQADQAMNVTAIVLFCASGTGIYGALVEGMTGDGQILIAKAILDFFTAAIFACTLGRSVSLIGVPQLAIFLFLFFLSGVIIPYCNDMMLADFKACGGIIMLATGLRMMKIRDFAIADMIPAMILVMPFSWIWANVILTVL